MHVEFETILSSKKAYWVRESYELGKYIAGSKWEIFFNFGTKRKSLVLRYQRKGWTEST